MDVDRILRTCNDHGVDYLLIGGMNFLLRHAPVLTYDVDLWVHDVPENLARCEAALAALGACWGVSEADWRPVAGRTAAGVAYRGLADEDMIACQLALPEAERRPGRIETITRALRGRGEA